LAVVVGLVTGLGAVVFRDLIGLIHNVTFLGIFSFDYDASVFTPPRPKADAHEAYAGSRRWNASQQSH
jgi:hypothetical protein